MLSRNPYVAGEYKVEVRMPAVGDSETQDIYLCSVQFLRNDTEDYDVDIELKGEVGIYVGDPVVWEEGVSPSLDRGLREEIMNEALELAGQLHREAMDKVPDCPPDEDR